MEENEEIVQDEIVTGEEAAAPPAEEKEEVAIEETTKMVPLAALEDERRKRQHLEQQLSQAQPEPETYFDDPKKDGVFKDYLKSPLKVISDINTEIANLEAVIPDDGADEYRKARKMIAFWNGVKDEFQAKRFEVSEKSRSEEIAASKVAGELGADFNTLLDFAKQSGFSEREFKTRPVIRTLVKNAYTAAHAAEAALKKETKPKPHQAAKPAGDGGGGGGDNEDDELNLSVAERIKRAEAHGY